MSNTESERQIFKDAKKLREKDPNTYGIKGSTKGSPGYVPGGWKKAIKVATEMYRESHGKGPSQETLERKKIGTIPHRLKDKPEQSALYRGYEEKLKELKTKYWNAGLEIRAVQPRKNKNPKAPTERKRLPPVLL